MWPCLGQGLGLGLVLDSFSPPYSARLCGSACIWLQRISLLAQLQSARDNLVVVVQLIEIVIVRDDSLGRSAPSDVCGRFNPLGSVGPVGPNRLIRLDYWGGSGWSSRLGRIGLVGSGWSGRVGSVGLPPPHSARLRGGTSPQHSLNEMGTTATC